MRTFVNHPISSSTSDVVDPPLGYRPTGKNLSLRKHSSMLVEAQTITLRGMLNCFTTNGRLVVFNVYEQDVNTLNSLVYEMITRNNLQGEMFIWNSDIPLFFTIARESKLPKEESFKGRVTIRLQGFQQSDSGLRGCVHVVSIV
jgi:hypothetical protein